MISLPLQRSVEPKREKRSFPSHTIQNRRSQIQSPLTRPSTSDVFFSGARKGTKGADDPSVLAAMLKMAKKMDGSNPFTPISITNRIYQETFPRELGIIVYGSSRTQEGTPEYLYDVAVGKALGSIEKNGKKMHVVTGGGPGAMRAVAEGATNVGAHAVGSAMNFIGETPSTDVHPEFVVHPNFAERIDAPGGYEHRGAYTAAVPGGPGTAQELWKKANELFYDQTLYPCQKLIVLFDFEDYYSAPRGFLDNLKFMVERGKANPKMINMFKTVKTPEEAAQYFLDPNIPWTPGANPPKANDPASTPGSSSTPPSTPH